MVVVLGVFFPDVAFFERTFLPSSIQPFLAKSDTRQASSALLPVLDSDAQAQDGFADLHSALKQFEPAHYGMARNLREQQSSWWNPYSAAGTLGPETLVDIKFSPHTLLTAWFFNASAAGFDFVLLGIYCVGFYFMLRIFLEIVRVGWVAALAGATVYVLSGFAMSNFNTGIGQPYFLYPMLLCSVLMFAKRSTVTTWLWMVLAHGVIFLANIMTTLILVLLTVHALGLAFFVDEKVKSRRDIASLVRYLLTVFAAGLSALCLVGFLWLPVLQSFFITDMAADFDKRVLPKPVGVENLLSIFTPKHFWDVFGHADKTGLYPHANLEKKVPHIANLGIVAAVVAANAWRRRSDRCGFLVAIGTVLLVLAYCRIFGWAGFIDALPVLHSIGNQYWTCMAALALAPLVAVGVQNLVDGRIHLVPMLAVLSVQLAGFFVLYQRLGMPELSVVRLHVIAVMAWMLFVVLMLLVFLFFLRWRADRLRKWLSGVVVLALVLELMSYMNTVRPWRYDTVQADIPLVQFLRQHIGDGRILNIGQQGTLMAEYGAAFGIRQADTMNAGLMPWYEQYFEKYFGNDTFFFLMLDGSVDKKRKRGVRKEYSLDPLALSAASIKYIVVSAAANPVYTENLQRRGYPVAFRDSSVTVFENSAYFPSLLLVNHLVQRDAVLSQDTAVTRDAHLLQLAVAEGVAEGVVEDVAAAPAPAPNSAVANQSDAVQVISTTNTEILAKVHVAKPSVLVQSDVWHPGWQATLNGQPLYIGRVNEAFRGMVLPVGQHEVRIFYDPPVLRYGRWLSLFTVAGLLVMSIVVYRRRNNA